MNSVKKEHNYDFQQIFTCSDSTTALACLKSEQTLTVFDASCVSKNWTTVLLHDGNSKNETWIKLSLALMVPFGMPWRIKIGLPGPLGSKNTLNCPTNQLHRNPRWKNFYLNHLFDEPPSNEDCYRAILKLFASTMLFVRKVLRSQLSIFLFQWIKK